MDFNRDGEVSFDEFVRWYSMSSARDDEDQPQHQSDATSPTSAVANGSAGLTPSTETTALARTDRVANALVPAAAGGGASRLLADLEKSLSLTDSRLRRTSSTDRPPQRSEPAEPTGGIDLSAAARGEWPTTLTTPSPVSLGVAAAAVVAASFGGTEAEKESARERWLAGGTAESEAEMPGAESTAGDASASKDLEKALELLCVLVKANADADTLIAALASCIIRNPMGRWGRLA